MGGLQVYSLTDVNRVRENEQAGERESESGVVCSHNSVFVWNICVTEGGEQGRAL